MHTNFKNIDKEFIRKVLTNRKRNIIKEQEGMKNAGVIMPIFEKEGEIYILLTKRTENVRDHKGQIAFPGGVMEKDDRTILDTALREIEEEIGLNRRDIDILGALDDIITLTGYQITAFVGYFIYPYNFNISKKEIVNIFELPLSEFMNPLIIRKEHNMSFMGKPYIVYYFDFPEHTVWGATARLIIQLLDIVYKWRI